MIAPGAGSRAEFVAECFAEAVTGSGRRLVTYDPGPWTLAGHAAAVRAAVSATGARWAGGISIGGLAALTVEGLERVVVALPGELGSPVHAAAALDVERYGVRGVLERMAADPDVPRWVVAEVAASWSGHGEESLLAALRAVAAEPPFVPPRRPDVVVAVTDDPLHPVSAAYALGDPLLTTLAAMGADRGVVGRLALRDDL